MADSPQLTKDINNAQTNPLDFIKVIGQLLQASTGNSDQQQQANSLNKQDQTQATQNAYQKGVNKALSEHGYNHGAEALASGVDPNEIANHSLMQPAMSMQNGNIGDTNGGNQVDPKQLLAGVLAAHLSNQSQQSQNQTQNLEQNAQINNQDQLTPIQQQAMNIVAPATTPIGKLFESLGIGNATKRYELGTLAKAQGILQQTPEAKLQLAQSSNTNALAEYQRMTNSGNKPVDPEQYMTAYSGMYQKAYEAHASVAKTGGDIAKTSQDLMKQTADQTRNAAQKAFGSQSKESQATLESAIAAQKAALDATGDFNRFMNQNSPQSVINTIKQNVSKNASVQKQSGLVKPGQSITINGKTIKRLN